jgi:magnesium chelatase subunit D
VPEPMGEDVLWARNDRVTDVALAAAVFAADPLGTGIVLRAGFGGPRERWLELLRALLSEGTLLRRLPVHIADDRLIGGLDLAATLSAGRPIAERGLLAEADGGVLVLPMAERLTSTQAARIASALDRGEVVLERDGFAARHPARFGVVALDEGCEADELPPAVLLDRLACHLDLDGVRAVDIATPLTRGDIAGARARLSTVEISADAIGALCATGIALGVASVTAPYLAVKVARAIAALDAAAAASDRHVAIAARLVLAPRATRLPALEDPEEVAELDPEPNDRDEAHDDRQESGALEDMVLAAAKAAIPPGLLASLIAGHQSRTRSPQIGRTGAQQSSARRGRPAGTRPGKPRGGARLDLIETLRAAAPWQPLRRSAARAETGKRLEIRLDDFRIRRLKQRSATVTIFIVDASGSTALARLAEAKGAVELLLADCYIRRDQVALIAFGGRGTEVLLPPTRSLARAKRSLADLPGGGGTPLAAGIDAAAVLAQSIRRKGQTPAIVILTDGRPNLARDGRPGRARAQDDALAAATALRGAGFPALLIDTSAQAEASAGAIAEAMGARYVPLPHADARALSRAVRSGLGGAGHERQAHL